MNVTPAPLNFIVPPSPTGRKWHQLIDTAAESPRDFLPENEGPSVIARSTLTVAPFGLVVLMSEV